MAGELGRRSSLPTLNEDEEEESGDEKMVDALFTLTSDQRKASVLSRRSGGSRGSGHEESEDDEHERRASQESISSSRRGSATQLAHASKASKESDMSLSRSKRLPQRALNQRRYGRLHDIYVRSTRVTGAESTVKDSKMRRRVKRRVADFEQRTERLIEELQSNVDRGLATLELLCQGGNPSRLSISQRCC
jgi:hypothetical protein